MGSRGRSRVGEPFGSSALGGEGAIQPFRMDAMQKCAGEDVSFYMCM